MKQLDGSDACILAGMALLFGGVGWLFGVAVTLIVAGAVLISWGLILQRAKGRR